MIIFLFELLYDVIFIIIKIYKGIKYYSNIIIKILDKFIFTLIIYNVN